VTFRRVVGYAAGILAVLLLAALLAVVARATEDIAAPAVQPATWNQLMGAGDIAPDPTAPGTGDLATSNLLLAADPRLVFTLGDNAYSWGTLAQYESPAGYGGSWGRLKDRTCATVGNHEYLDPAGPAAGFLAYFADNCPVRTVDHGPFPTVYAYRCAPGSGWWCYVLDSQCRHPDGTGPPCTRFGAMLTWWRYHMATHPTRCRLVMWHHPRWGSGNLTTDDPQVGWLWKVAAYGDRVSLVLNGHNHGYERFTSRTASGQPDRSFAGPRNLIVGTGGVNLIPFGSAPPPGSRYRTAAHFGVVRLTLTPKGWASQFETTGGQILDKAGAGC